MCFSILKFLFQVDSLVKLSGMPDLTLTFINPRLLDDVSFHPCVRFKRWEVGILLSSYHKNKKKMGQLEKIALIILKFE